jgi:serine O-acetyltransferase
MTMAQNGIKSARRGDRAPLSAVVNELCQPNGVLTRRPDHRPLPSHDAIVRIVESLRAVLFPGYFGESELETDAVRYRIGAILDKVRRELREQIKRGLCFNCTAPGPRCEDCEGRAEEMTDAFLGRLGEVRRLLATDVQAAYEGDPAAHSPDETIFCYPGIMAVTNQRLAHELHLLGVPLIPRIITEHAHSLTGIDIHPGAQIGESFFIDHGTGVVIGETARLGARVRLYQGVTLGAKSFPLDEFGNPIKGIDRHPKVEDDVIIYSGATVLGNVTIGHGSVIGGNVWLTHSVPPGSRITQAESTHEDHESGGGI